MDWNHTLAISNAGLNRPPDEPGRSLFMASRRHDTDDEMDRWFLEEGSENAVLGIDSVAPIDYLDSIASSMVQQRQFRQSACSMVYMSSSATGDESVSDEKLRAWSSQRRIHSGFGDMNSRNLLRPGGFLEYRL